MITLTLTNQPAVPLEAENLSPDVMAGLTLDAVRALPVFLGKRQCRVDDFFEVEGDAVGQAARLPPLPWVSDEDAAGMVNETGMASEPLALRIHGECDKVKWIGRGMTKGRIHIKGNAGMHLGAYMKGGSIEVSGNASDWVGAEMTGGLIRVQGHAGGQIGAAYRGSSSGMMDGTIIVEGSAGMEVGMRMKRGIIAVKGPVRDFAGLQMKGGTIFLLGGAEIRTGAWMSRGTIVALKPIPLLPTFSLACSYQPTFLSLYAKYLQTLGINIPTATPEGAYDRYMGDAAVPGKGEIFLWRPGKPS